MSVRTANPEDLKDFMNLWEEMFTEVHEKYPKSDSGPTRKNLNFYTVLFETYVKGFANGIVVFWYPNGVESPQGVIMVGERLGVEESLDSRWENPAWIHGIYVTPDYRCKGGWRALQRAAKPYLLELGFTDVLGWVTAGNSDAFKMNTISGGEPYAILMERSI